MIEFIFMSVDCIEANVNCVIVVLVGSVPSVLVCLLGVFFDRLIAFLPALPFGL